LTSSKFNYTRIAIAGLGAATPIGQNSAASAAAVRAGVAGFSHHPFMGDSVGKPICVAQCPWLVDEPSVVMRISNCLIAAVRQAVSPLEKASDVTLFANLPARRPGLQDLMCEAVHEALAEAFAGFFKRIALAELGHAGGIVAIQSAIKSLRLRPDSICVVAGADSYLDPDTLEWLEDSGQLHGAGKRNNAWGFIPGEGSGALLIMTFDGAVSSGLPILGEIAGIGVGQETSLIRTGKVCLGEGLTAAVGGALASTFDDEKVTDVYCDMNGDPYRADEFGFTVSRLRHRFVSASDFVAPADCWGDVGAASAPLGINLACAAAAKGYASGATSLVWASSDGGERGAAVIRTVEPAG
jgi:3-oxoacyl-[acyl-carrier-protein] synthase-1